MELKGERIIPAPVDRTWQALNDPAVLKASIAGCESLERVGDDRFQALMAVRVGPVSARFKGQLQLADVQPPQRYTIHFEGQGGVAGFGKGSAEVQLEPQGERTRLSYHARAQVGGKIAQVGSRLVDAAAAKITQDFFEAFEAALQPAGEVVAPPAPSAPAAPSRAWIGWAVAAALLAAALLWWATR